jgi:hypothetical protein
LPRWLWTGWCKDSGGCGVAWESAMNKRRAVRNLVTAGILITVALIGGIAALSSIHLVMSLPR